MTHLPPAPPQKSSTILRTLAVAAVIGLILFGVLWITTPSYLPPLLENPTGQKMLIFAVVMMVVAVFWMRKIIRIDM